VRVLLDADRMNAHGVAPLDLRNALQLANVSLPAGSVVRENREIVVETGNYLESAADVASLVVGTHDGRPVHVSDVARSRTARRNPARYAWTGNAKGEFPAVTLQVTKKPGENAVNVAERVLARAAELRGTVIPAEVEVERDAQLRRDRERQGAAAHQEARSSPRSRSSCWSSPRSAGARPHRRRGGAAHARRDALRLLGLGLHAEPRVALRAHLLDRHPGGRRHRRGGEHPPPARLERGPLSGIIPAAVDEVGGPTILATFTVIAALLPMAFVTGLMGPYMSPIPINASMGMLISLAIAFTVTPWLALKLLRRAQLHADGRRRLAGGGSRRLLNPFLASGPRRRALLGVGSLVLIALVVSLAAVQLVVLKMLPFDNKSEFQVVVDMPAGTPVEVTAAALRELGAHLATCPRSPTTRPTRGSRRRSTSTAWCASTTCARARSRATCR
jgi:multidrug efflux pump subunit AcrB